ncbi:dTMP kinase [Thalassolituus marinus]|uniref:Thymidylate kinase n=1 Tax=Thalassolituus marinus TaxID=671053 RepID=A0ABS7ZKT8_9GAMM|nr:dTMP kinase [Thalassolituus marinus]MCA6062329.1 dTMP kinase [Thalassolituus marinus]
MSNPSKGRFITFEGGEGVGKSTNIHFCATWLRDKGIGVITTREPGGTPVAETIREKLLKAHHEEPVDPLAELLLMFAARAQHLNTLILPALEAGTWVLCDRFTDSTIAYQGYGRQLPMEHIHNLKALVQHNLEPDRTFLLDAPLEVGMGRARARADSAGEQIDRFETEKLAFFERVQHGFHALAAAEERFATIDASRPLTDVQQDLALELEKLL